MYRATTPTFTFVLPINTSRIDTMKLTFKQYNTVLTLNKADVTLSGNNITVQLTQEQTNMFTACDPVKIQIRIKETTTGVVSASEIVEAKVYGVLDETEL